MKCSKLVLACFLAFLIVPVLSSCSKKKAETPKAAIKIGAVFSVTGNGAKLGGPEKNAAMMVAEEINAAGGVNGSTIELIIEDDQTNPENTTNSVKKLITRDMVSAIIGPSVSASAYAAAPICEADSMPLISCAAAWTQLFPEKDVAKPMYKFVFKTPQNDSDCARKIFEDCKARGFTKVALITSASGFGQAGRIELKKFAPDFGIKIVSDETYPPDATDLTSILTKIRSKNPQAVVNWSVDPAQVVIAGQMKQLKMKAQLYQSHGFGNKNNITPEAEGLLFPAGRLLVVADMDTADVQYKVLKKFKTDYEAKYSEEVSTFAGHAYDALNMVVEAIKSKGVEKNSIREGLEGLTGFVGTAGVFNMKPADHCGLDSNAFVMITVKDGQFRLASAVQSAPAAQEKPAPKAK
ncbi:MAG: ABC transporter substrate-binding protein [Candidatus Latescibacterota bacterium]